jgi:sulfur-carrier protein
MATVRVILPQHLQILANCTREVRVEVTDGVTQQSIIDALERTYPQLLGTLRDHGSTKRRPMIRFFACQEDVSNESPDSPLPAAIASGEEPFYVIGAIAGG